MHVFVRVRPVPVGGFDELLVFLSVLPQATETAEGLHKQVQMLRGQAQGLASQLKDVTASRNELQSTLYGAALAAGGSKDGMSMMTQRLAAVEHSLQQAQEERDRLNRELLSATSELDRARDHIDELEAKAVLAFRRMQSQATHH